MCLLLRNTDTGQAGCEEQRGNNNDIPTEHSPLNICGCECLCPVSQLMGTQHIVASVELVLQCVKIFVSVYEADQWLLGGTRELSLQNSCAWMCAPRDVILLSLQ